MFAFALWDAANQSLILARDPLGVKPLYLHVSSRLLQFASEVRALVRAGTFRSTLSLQGLNSYLELGAVQDPYTLLEQVRSLPAGHIAIWHRGDLKVKEYWSLRDRFARRSKSLPRGELREQVRTLLGNAVRSRLVSDAPIGVFLSGGIDSSAVATLAAQQSSTTLRTVSVVFKEEAYSEKRFADIVSARLGSDHTEVCLSHDEFLLSLPQALQAMDQPTFDGVNTYVVSGAARAAGLTVALSGIGGDELFGGYPSFRRVPQMRSMRRLLPAGFRKAAATLISISGTNDKTRKLAAWIEDPDSISAEALTRELFSCVERRQLLGEEGTREDGQPVALLGLDDFNSVSLYELAIYMKNVLLRDTDFMSMAHSLEVREPLLDIELVSLLASLPGSFKLGGTSKALLVDAIDGDLPREVLYRKKRGFTLPFDSWLRGPLRQSIEEVLFDSTTSSQLANMVPRQFTEDIWNRFMCGSTSWTRPWALYVLKQWESFALGADLGSPDIARLSMTPSQTA
jgi:asparagine synthase (glutamine-hydrolysing)